MIKTSSDIQRRDKYSQLSTMIWSVWANGWMFLYKLSGCRFVSRCSHLDFRCRACFKQGVPWHSGKYRMWIHSEMRTWYDINIQSIAPYRYILRTQLNHLVSFAKWFSFCLRTKWLWVWVPLRYLNFRYSACFEQRIPWHSGKYRVWIHSETRMWVDYNIQSNVPYR